VFTGEDLLLQDLSVPGNGFFWLKKL